MDTVSPETRSRVMALVRSQGNRSTEWRLRAYLIRAGIQGWQLNPKDLLGKPDFVFRRRVSTTLRHSDMEFSEYLRLSFAVC